MTVSPRRPTSVQTSLLTSLQTSLLTSLQTSLPTSLQTSLHLPGSGFLDTAVIPLKTVSNCLTLIFRLNLVYFVQEIEPL